MSVDIQKLADLHADAVIKSKYAQIDKKSLRSTSTGEEVIKVTSALLLAKKQVVSTRKSLIAHALKDVKAKLGWLDEVDPNQLPLPLPTFEALSIGHEGE